MVDRNALAEKLRGFKIRNVRLEEPFDLGTKRVKASEVLIPVKGKLLLACTDERKVKEIIIPKTSTSADMSQYTLVRAAGAGFGLVDAIRNVRVTIQRQEILSALSENGVIVANHVDTQAKEGEFTGCRQAGLRALPESGSVFDRPMVTVNERIAAFEELGVLRVVLEGELLAEGFVVNPFSEKALDPTVEAAGHAFFSLDLGVYKEILHWISGALKINDEVVRSILVKLTRNNMAAVFILSNGAIADTAYVELNDDQDSYFAGILHEALAELKEREGSMLSMIEARSGA